jgi:crotonobetainyl-CoA:carnitine CoA-transferase CaiB-like acyl-CoA transferase
VHETAEASELPLAGLRVIDLTHMLAGPYATMLLADMGADVVKVESLDGEFIRHAGPNITDQDSYGGYFQSVNRNKRSLALDLKTDDGREIFLKLVEHSDALVENFRTGVMEKLGFGYEQLRTVNSRLVYGCIRGFGDPRTGESPYVDWPAYDVIAQAMGGVMEVTGLPDGEPMKTGPGIGDIFPASLLATGLLAALYAARITGKGRFVDVAMYDAMLSLSERIVYQHSFSGSVPTRQGNSHPFFEPFGVFPALDGWVTIAAPSDVYWRILLTRMDRADLIQDPRFEKDAARNAHRDEVRMVVAEWTSARTTAEIRAALGGHVPFGPVQNIEAILADPHVAARHMIATVAHPPSGREVRIAGQPVKFAGLPDRPPRPAPTLGQDTELILGGLGYEPDVVEILRKKGVLR